MSGFKDGYEPTQADLDNYSRQLDPENDAYWQSRGYDEPQRMGRITMSKKVTPPNGPSKTGNPSGKGRGNNPPKK